MEDVCISIARKHDVDLEVLRCRWRLLRADC
jgi:hypothetical protein